MVILITGASHTGKTFLAQRMLEKYNYPYLSIDHLKMGLIRSGITRLTPEDDAALTVFLWPIVREIIKTVIENRQNLIAEGCYVPFDWRQDFDGQYVPFIRFICLAMTENYIEKHFAEIIAHESEIESRFFNPNCSIEELKKENDFYLSGFRLAGEHVTLIDSDYKSAVNSLLEEKDASPFIDW